MTTTADVKSQLIEACEANTLLIPKHDPAGITGTYSTFRTVLSEPASGDLTVFVKSNDYKLDLYEQKGGRFDGKPYVVLTPLNAKYFDVSGSGVLSNTIIPLTGGCDVLVAVNHPTSGWHCYAENSHIITALSASGSLSAIS